MGDAISAQVSRGRALGYYIERRESGAAGAFQAKSREEADKILEETIAKIAAKQAVERAKANTHRSVCERVPSIPSSICRSDPFPANFKLPLERQRSDAILV